MSDETPITDELACICSDPFRTGECPLHPSESISEPYGDTTKDVAVTAAHRSEPTRKTGWVGFTFLCDCCGKNAIMHWFKFCPECGSKLAFDFEIPEDI